MIADDEETEEDEALSLADETTGSNKIAPTESDSHRTDWSAT
jgi:hypothetical protein